MDGVKVDDETEAPYNFHFDSTTGTTQFRNGPHSLLARGYSASNGSTLDSCPLSITIQNGTTTPPTTTPATPGNLTATAVSSSQINLSWTAVVPSGASVPQSYQVFRNGVQVAKGVTSTSYGDANLSPSTLYSYTVRAVDANGNVSKDSNTASATTAAPIVTTLKAGQYIQRNQYLASADGQYILLLQTDGNLVAWTNTSSSHRPYWYSNTYDKSGVPGGSILVMQTDGNLVLYDVNWKPVWYTRTNGTSANQLSMQKDGSAVLLNANNTVIQQVVPRAP
jgi:hypothetical protein